MTPQEYRTALSRLGLTVSGKRGAGKLLDYSDRTSRVYAGGQREIPKTVELALQKLIADHEGS